MTHSPPAPPSEMAPFRDLLNDAIRYWEPRRIPYNVALTAVVLGWVAFTWPHFRTAITLPSALFLFVLAVLANACYCAAYLADIPMQYSSFRGRWQRWRWGIWLLGTLFAASLTYFWIADEIYPSVG